jgi:hypothetical protein
MRPRVQTQIPPKTKIKTPNKQKTNWESIVAW